MLSESPTLSPTSKFNFSAIGLPISTASRSSGLRYCPLRIISGDRDRLRELLNNLLDNAILYTQTGGRVTVRMRRTDERHCELSVSDDGPRIPLHERQRVFERFHRLLGSSRDGSGLGLSIAREIAHIHGAEISAACCAGSLTVKLASTVMSTESGASLSGSAGCSMQE